jgi:hypothetical protein
LAAHSVAFARGQRGWGCLEFISNTLGGGVTLAEPLNGIPDTWGRIKCNTTLTTPKICSLTPNSSKL